MSQLSPETEPTPAPTAADTSGILGAGSVAEREFTVRAMTSRELVTRRFFRHRGALGGLAAFAVTVILAFTSIGFGPIPGWWSQSYTTTGVVENAGHMTLDVLPSFVDGDGFAIGKHPFGQDDVGRDYFALTMRGAQRSLIICLMVGVVSTLIGVVIGAIAGFFTTWVSSALMRLTDLFLVLPLLVIAAVLGRKFGNGGPLLLAVVLGLLTWTSLARLVRGEFLSLREKEFVEAARAMGATNMRIIFRHMLPNVLGTIIVSATLAVAAAIILETALSYLGLGVRPPDTSLGLLISDYENSFSTRPWLFWWPGLFIIAIALSVNFIGDGLRDAFDPRQTRVRA